MSPKYYIVCENTHPNQKLSVKNVLQDLHRENLVLFTTEDEAKRYCDLAKENKFVKMSYDEHKLKSIPEEEKQIKEIEGNVLQINLPAYGPFLKETFTFPTDFDDADQATVKTAHNGWVTVKKEEGIFKLHFELVNSDEILAKNRPTQTILQISLPHPVIGRHATEEGYKLKRIEAFYPVEDNNLPHVYSNEPSNEPKKNLIIVTVEMNKRHIALNGDRRWIFESSNPEKEVEIRRDRDSALSNNFYFVDPRKMLNATSTEHSPFWYVKVDNPDVSAVLKVNKADGSASLNFPTEYQKIGLLRNFVFAVHNEDLNLILKTISPKELHQLFADLQEENPEQKQIIEKKKNELVAAYIRKEEDQKPKNAVLKAIYNLLMRLFSFNSPHFYQVDYTSAIFSTYKKGRENLQDKEKIKTHEVSKEIIQGQDKVTFAGTLYQKNRFDLYVEFQKKLELLQQKQDAEMIVYRQFLKELNNHSAALWALLKKEGKLEQLNYHQVSKLKSGFTFINDQALSPNANCVSDMNQHLKELARNVTDTLSATSELRKDPHFKKSMEQLKKYQYQMDAKIAPRFEKIRRERLNLESKTKDLVAKSKKASAHEVERHHYYPSRLKK